MFIRVHRRLIAFFRPAKRRSWEVRVFDGSGYVKRGNPPRPELPSRDAGESRRRRFGNRPAQPFRNASGMRRLWGTPRTWPPPLSDQCRPYQYSRNDVSRRGGSSQASLRCGPRPGPGRAPRSRKWLPAVLPGNAASVYATAFLTDLASFRETNSATSSACS